MNLSGANLDGADLFEAKLYWARGHSIVARLDRVIELMEFLIKKIDATEPGETSTLDLIEFFSGKSRSLQ